MNSLRFGLMRTVAFTALVLVGVLMHVGRSEAGEAAPAPLTKSLRAEGAGARAAIKSEAAAALRKEARATAAKAVLDPEPKLVTMALQAASVAAPVHGLMVVPTGYSAHPTP
jgi:hypothetical protein